MKKLTNQEWIRKRFPDGRARALADEAMLALPDDATMLRHMQCWVDAYANARVR